MGQRRVILDVIDMLALLEKLSAMMTEERVLGYGSVWTIWAWLTAGMNGLTIISTGIVIALGLVKLRQALARERDKRWFKEAFRRAEEAGDDQLRAAVIEAHERALSEPGALGPR
jgi:hypothetical protein